MSRVTAMTSISAFKLLVESFDVLGVGGEVGEGPDGWRKCVESGVWVSHCNRFSATTIVPNDVHHTISTAKYLHRQWYVLLN
jgi:hypothetical protein